MKKPKILFALITIAAAALMIYCGLHLKINGAEMSRPVSLAWGAIFVGSALTVVRGIKYLGRL
ncbi:MAG: hypothetical protein ACO3N7_09285 [Kiritimatiellia bacterium]